MVKREGTLDDNVQHLYSLVLGQCIDLLQTKLKQQTNWKRVSDEQNGIALLTMIKKVVHKFEDQKFVPLAHYNAKAAIYAFCQGNLTKNEYLKKFNNLVDLICSYQGKLYDKPLLDIVVESEHTSQNFDQLMDNEKAAVKLKAHDLACATIFLAQCNKRRYGKLI